MKRAGFAKRGLVWGTLFTVILVLSLGGVAQAKKPIKIGSVYILSGFAATYGKFAKNGLTLAVEEINKAGGVLGRPFKVTFEDSRAKPPVALRAFRKLVFEEKVDALIGLDSSGVALSVVPVLKELKTPLIITHAATPDVTGKKCNKYAFRVSANLSQNVQVAARIAAKTGARKWTTIGPDYAFGHQTWEYFQKYLKKLNPKVAFMTTTAFPKIATEDYTPYITTIMNAKPDGVIISLWSGDLINFIRQAKKLGFFKGQFKVLMTLGAATEVLYALKDQMPTGIWVGTRYWFLANNSAVNKKFIKAYKRKYHVYPSYNAQNAYAAAYVLKAAIEKAGKVDKEAIVKALEGLEIEVPVGKIKIRAGDHQALLDVSWGKTAADPKYPIRILKPIVTFKGSEITPKVSETGCKR
ncbi:MAG: ABC transporter substrate-binding protein [Deltaproteobacteria bacterium]|nr:ABC transporter substrate-binding protein [Deltaproteobacteria bacterium]